MGFCTQALPYVRFDVLFVSVQRIALIEPFQPVLLHLMEIKKLKSGLASCSARHHLLCTLLDNLEGSSQLSGRSVCPIKQTALLLLMGSNDQHDQPENSIFFQTHFLKL